MVDVRLVESSASISTGSSGFWPLATTNLGTSGGVEGSASTSTQVRYESAGVFSNFGVTNTAHVGTGPLGTKKNATTTGNCTVSLNATGIIEDTTHTDSVAAGDDWDIFNSSAASNTVKDVAVTFAASTNTVSRLVNTALATFNVSSSTTYYNAWGGNIPSTGNTTETAAQVTIKKAGTMKNLMLRTNGNITGDKLQSRIGAGFGALVATTSGSGLFEDTTNVDNVSAGNLINSAFVTTSTSNNQITAMAAGMGVDFISTAGDSFHTNSDTGATTIAITTARYTALGGNMVTSTTETDYQVTARDLYTYSNVTCNVTTNGFAQAATITLRSNAASPSGGPSASITASVTGQFTDTTHTYTVLAVTEKVNYLITPASGGTSMTVVSISIHANLVPPAGVTWMDAWVPRTVFIGG